MSKIASSSLALSVNRVSFLRGEVVILQDISFSLLAGEYVGIVGPNGGGKTTLLQILLGLLRPTSGTVTWRGAFADRAFMGYVPQHAATFDPFFPATVYDIVASGRSAHRLWFARADAHDRACIVHALETCGITHLAQKRIGEISGGERQRAFLARALAAEPRVLVLDEPMSAVDEAHQETFYDVLRTLHERDHLTILMISHDLQAIERETTRVLCLNKHLIPHDTYGNHAHMH